MGGQAMLEQEGKDELMVDIGEEDDSVEEVEAFSPIEDDEKAYAVEDGSGGDGNTGDTEAVDRVAVDALVNEREGGKGEEKHNERDAGQPVPGEAVADRTK